MYVKRPPQNQLVNAQELPVQMKHTTVSKLPNMVKIDNEFGLLIYCRLDMFACNVTVSGHHHNKTLGMQFFLNRGIYVIRHYVYVNENTYSEISII